MRYGCKSGHYAIPSSCPDLSRLGLLNNLLWHDWLLLLAAPLLAKWWNKMPFYPTKPILDTPLWVSEIEQKDVRTTTNSELQKIRTCQPKITSFAKHNQKRQSLENFPQLIQDSFQTFKHFLDCLYPGWDFSMRIFLRDGKWIIAEALKYLNVQ